MILYAFSYNFYFHNRIYMVFHIKIFHTFQVVSFSDQNIKTPFNLSFLKKTIKTLFKSEEQNACFYAASC